MSTQLVVGADEVIEQIMIQCWLFQARGADRTGARRNAERTLERLLARGLPHSEGPLGLRLDPYAANNMIRARRNELDDEAWSAWQQTTRRNALSLPASEHHYRLTIRREWHGYTVTPDRPVVLRMPLPLRGAQRGPARVRWLEPAGTPAGIRELPGRVELRIEGARTFVPLVAELEVDFVAGEQRDPLTPARALGDVVSAGEDLWLRDREGLVVQGAAVQSLADRLAANAGDARAYVHAIWRWLMQELRFGDWHRGDLDRADPLAGLLQTRRADCMLGSSLLIALCRARGIPARLLTGYLLHPANLGPHSWAEVRLAPEVWVPFDFGSWCYCAGDADDADWGNFFRGRVDARFVGEVAPREFTGWGSAPPPERWYRLEKLEGQRIVHSLHALPENRLFRRDVLDLQVLGPA